MPNDQLYVTLVAEVMVNVPIQQGSSKLEHYKFVYDIHEVPRPLVLDDGAVSGPPYLAILVATIFVAILAFGCIGYLCLKKLIPLISRVSSGNDMIINEEIKQDSKPTIDENMESNKNLESDANV